MSTIDIASNCSVFDSTADEKESYLEYPEVLIALMELLVESWKALTGVLND